MLIPVLKRQFKEKTGRDISDEELEVLKQKALSQFGAFGGGGGCCGDDHEHEHHGHDGHEHGNEAVIHFDPAIVPILQKQFRDRHGREARNDELQELLDIMADALDSFGTEMIMNVVMVVVIMEDNMEVMYLMEMNMNME
eukprot:CAMPEP_0114656120 /NCGR_PEP_ID=MMETSP0191-20121206/11844_1 /TAXON_ID=126664 /ORGANISM="Sorites sp." /LENGTH=139 /DNA_ID=CAMNT_0001872653 /DNA_START=524 /DNA_END=944 /DNA_ORIENTATION=-